ncbi:MAG: hypothetical protein AAF468_18730 [Pseudomonadota bacterium]
MSTGSQTQADQSPVIPFRWDVSRREQLGRLAQHEPAEIPDGYYEEVRAVCARILAMSDDCDLVFVGRSPEHLFDYLSGSFQAIAKAPDLTLFQFSKSYRGPHWNLWTGPRDFRPNEIEALLSYLTELGLDPLSLMSSHRAVRFVDFVHMGSTFNILLHLLDRLSKLQSADWKQVEKRIGFLGITCRTKNSPNTFRWQQSESWLEIAGNVSAKNVSVPLGFWSFCANESPKVTHSFHRGRWLNPDAAGPEYGEKISQALARSVDLFDHASGSEERKAFARELSATPGTEHGWFRHLAHELKFAR